LDQKISGVKGVGALKLANTLGSATRIKARPTKKEKGSQECRPAVYEKRNMKEGPEEVVREEGLVEGLVCNAGKRRSPEKKKRTQRNRESPAHRKIHENTCNFQVEEIRSKT